MPYSGRIRPFGRLPFLPEAVICLDSPDPARLGRVAGHLEKIPRVINIDHHVSNTFYGDHNWVLPGSACVGEMIYHLSRAWKVPLTRSLALCVYVTLLTDMGKFQFMITPSDGVRVLRLAARLVSIGLVPYDIYKQVYNYSSEDQLIFLAEALKTLEFHCGRRIASLTVTREMLKRCGVGDGASEGVIAYPRDLADTRIAVVFTEKKGGVKVSLRSKEPKKIDVNRLAAAFGGGGHPAAAGVEIKGRLSGVRSRVLKTLEQALNC
jgi:phosphoesterase RecJ-like protein